MAADARCRADRTGRGGRSGALSRGHRDARRLQAAGRGRQLRRRLPSVRVDALPELGRGRGRIPGLLAALGRSAGRRLRADAEARRSARAPVCGRRGRSREPGDRRPLRRRVRHRRHGAPIALAGNRVLRRLLSRGLRARLAAAARRADRGLRRRGGRERARQPRAHPCVLAERSRRGDVCVRADRSGRTGLGRAKGGRHSRSPARLRRPGPGGGGRRGRDVGCCATSSPRPSPAELSPTRRYSSPSSEPSSRTMPARCCRPSAPGVENPADDARREPRGDRPARAGAARPRGTRVRPRPPRLGGRSAQARRPRAARPQARGDRSSTRAPAPAPTFRTTSLQERT